SSFDWPYNRTLSLGSYEKKPIIGVQKLRTEA
ncbi:hypothetical protein ACUXGM_003338, partial [Cytobacillus horneckiae]